MKSDEFWVIDGDEASGPYLSIEECKASIEGWRLRNGSNIRIAKTVVIPVTEVIYATTWEDR